jgi:hypothetical protein
MRFTRTLIALAAAGALNVSCAMAQSRNDSSQSGQQQQQRQQAQQSGQPGQSGQAQQQQQQAPEGFVLIDERVVTLTANEPQNHFLRAHAALLRGDNRTAAAETRIAAAYLDMQASRDRNQGGQELKSAADNLRSIAKEIQNSAPQQGQQGQIQQHNQTSTSVPGSQQGQVGAQANQQGQSNTQSNTQANQQGQSGSQTLQQGQARSQYDQQLTQAFAQANHALAQHFEKVAKNELQQKRTVMAGYDIDSAATSLQAACAWSSKKPQQEVQTAITDARRAAMELLTPNMTAAQREAQEPANTGQQGSDNEAQPAAARISPSDQGNQATATQTQQETQDAQKALDELSKAIQSTASDLGGSAKNSSDNNNSNNNSSNKTSSGGANK